MLADYDAALRRSLALIHADRHPDRSLAAVQARANDRLDRCRRFLAYLGNPERGPTVVHVTGTSGKGSTAAMIASILGQAGYRVGLATSPYLQAATEKVQIDGRLLPASEFHAGLAEVLEAGARWRRSDAEDLSYGEYWLALTALAFQRHAVDVAVIEVGAGGRFDLTNVVAPAVAVITNVALDHAATLGPTLADIAWHKAGIIKRGAVVVTGERNPVALGAIEREAAAVGANVVASTAVRPIPHVGQAGLEAGGNGRPGPGQWAPLLRMRGRFQARNATLAVAAVDALTGVGFDVPDLAVASGLAAAALPGRGEWMPDWSGPPVLLDGAHNPAKMRAFAEDLLAEQPASERIGVVSIAEGKDVDAMLAMLLPSLTGLVATRVNVTGKAFIDPHRLARRARHLGFAGPIVVVTEPLASIERAADLATTDEATLLATGSLYLVGALRERWFPTAAIVLQRTPWPTSAG